MMKNNMEQIRKWKVEFETEKQPLVLESLAPPEMTKAGQQQNTLYRLIHKSHMPGVVMIVRKADKIALVYQDRPAVGSSLWELPRGRVDETDINTQAAAEREISEELNIKVTKPVFLGKIFPDSGLLGIEVNVYQFDYLEENENKNTTNIANNEIAEIKWQDLDEIKKEIREKRLSDGISLSAMSLYLVNL